MPGIQVLLALVAVSFLAAPGAAEPAPEGLVFQDLDGRPVTLATVVGNRPTVLVFLRHFG